jgi:hypothetical protein
MTKRPQENGDTGPEWFTEWLDGHLARHPGRAWEPIMPHTEQGERFFHGWKLAFEQRHVTLEEAQTATLAMQAESPQLPPYQLPRILWHIDKQREAQQAPAYHSPDMLRREADNSRWRRIGITWEDMDEQQRNDMRARARVSLDLPDNLPPRFLDVAAKQLIAEHTKS